MKFSMEFTKSMYGENHDLSVFRLDSTGLSKKTNSLEIRDSKGKIFKAAGVNDDADFLLLLGKEFYFVSKKKYKKLYKNWP